MATPERPDEEPGQQPGIDENRLAGEALIKTALGDEYAQLFLSGGPRTSNVYVFPHLNSREFDGGWLGQPNATHSKELS